jgi:sterol desaturase/sphingolipid hydroxylase (fatty acid hydroxylase superfamily)
MTPAAERPVPLLVRAAIVGGLAASVYVLERCFPLRRRVAAGPARILRNLAISAGAGAVVLTGELPMAAILTRWVSRRRIGLAQWSGLPSWARNAAGVLWLDYTTYVWHACTHHSRFLWRFHRVHHGDRDLDSTTALRFHAGEMLLSLPFRAGQIVLGGVSPRAFSLWQIGFFASVLLHHSNLRLPEPVERRLALLFITPRMHGIHHSRVRRERDSNWSSGFSSLWDHLHGTFRFDVPQEEIDIGVEGCSAPGADRLLPMLRLPWQSDENAPC